MEEDARGEAAVVIALARGWLLRMDVLASESASPPSSTAGWTEDDCNRCDRSAACRCDRDSGRGWCGRTATSEEDG